MRYGVAVFLVFVFGAALGYFLARSAPIGGDAMATCYRR